MRPRGASDNVCVNLELVNKTILGCAVALNGRLFRAVLCAVQPGCTEIFPQLEELRVFRRKDCATAARMVFTIVLRVRAFRVERSG
jgi:hypothetical protein